MLNVWCHEMLFLVQDSLRYLVQDSLAAFTRMIQDATYSVIDLADDFDWGPDIINSPYKYEPVYNSCLNCLAVKTTRKIFITLLEESKIVSLSRRPHGRVFSGKKDLKVSGWDHEGKCTPCPPFIPNADKIISGT